MFQIVLFEPEIPPNTGNIMRLSANVGATLHLIHPLGFELSERHLRRAGMDYRDLVPVHEHSNWQDFADSAAPRRVFALTTKGSRRYSDVVFEPGDVLLFGPESRGLPAALLASLGPNALLYVPMVPGSRSLNLSNTVALVVYEAWRQCAFTGAAPRSSG
ncbi:MAG: tRNA (cytidine(34)-2'-O)-methyltransferase [Methylotetracoccus sp.]|nr:tRNA (cytidine(34)-2'-O)-methyltransferase [Methylotetracoccus sp.]